MHKGKVNFAFCSSINDSPSEVFRRHFSRTRLLPPSMTVVLVGLAELYVYSAQDPVHKSAGRSAPERFCELYRFVYSNAPRNLRFIGIQKLGQPQAKEVAVNSSDFLSRPFGGCNHDDAVYFFLLCNYCLHELFHERHVGIARSKFFRVMCKTRKDAVLR